MLPLVESMEWTGVQSKNIIKAMRASPQQETKEASLMITDRKSKIS